MKLINIPTRMGVPWASSAGAGYINTVPVPSQIGVTDGKASYTDGFVPINFSPIESGGVPPFGQDANGVINDITKWLQWVQAGNPIQYDSAFSTVIGGYPKGCQLQSTTLGVFWLNAADDNTTDPDGGSPANWLKCFVGNYYGVDAGSTANVYSLSFAPPLTAHQPGLVIRCKISHTNTGASTFDPTNTSTPKTIKTPSGVDPLANQLITGQVAALVYDGTFYQVLNPALGTAATKGVTGNTGTVASWIGGNSAGQFVSTDASGNLQSSGSTPASFFQLVNNLSEGSLSAKRGNLGFDYSGISASVPENTYTVLYTPGHESGIWAVWANRADVGNVCSIAFYFGIDVADTQLQLADQYHTTGDSSDITFEGSGNTSIRAKRNVGAGTGQINWMVAKILGP